MGGPPAVDARLTEVRRAQAVVDLARGKLSTPATSPPRRAPATCLRRSGRLHVGGRRVRQRSATSAVAARRCSGWASTTRLSGRTPRRPCLSCESVAGHRPRRAGRPDPLLRRTTPRLPRLEAGHDAEARAHLERSVELRRTLAGPPGRRCPARAGRVRDDSRRPRSSCAASHRARSLCGRCRALEECWVDHEVEVPPSTPSPGGARPEADRPRATLPRRSSSETSTRCSRSRTTSSRRSGRPMSAFGVPVRRQWGRSVEGRRRPAARRPPWRLPRSPG